MRPEADLEHGSSCKRLLQEDEDPTAKVTRAKAWAHEKVGTSSRSSKAKLKLSGTEINLQDDDANS